MLIFDIWIIFANTSFSFIFIAQYKLYVARYYHCIALSRPVSSFEVFLRCLEVILYFILLVLGVGCMFRRRKTCRSGWKLKKLFLDTEKGYYYYCYCILYCLQYHLPSLTLLPTILRNIYLPHDLFSLYCYCYCNSNNRVYWQYLL